MVDRTTPEQPVLSVRNLVIVTDGDNGEEIVLVDDVSFDVLEGEVLCIVGESGSGKSLTMLAVMGLLPASLRIAHGSIEYRGTDLTRLSDAEMRRIRGKEIGMVFQDPMTSLNPLRRVGNQLAEAVRLHSRVTRKTAFERVHELLRQVGVPQPETRARAFPHEWSGGMRQRAMIAMAMANNPSLLIADEPTTALDVTIQAQVMQGLADVRSEVGSAMVLITHNLGLAAENASRIVIMYSGRVVESGDVATVFAGPTHPYTQGLLASLLTGTGQRAYAIPGSPPSPRDRPHACAFAARCSLRNGRDVCIEVRPQLALRANGSVSACHFADELLGDELVGEVRA